VKLEDVIKNDEENQFCLEEVSRLMDGDPDINSKEGVLLRVLATVIQSFEKKHYPIGKDEETEKENRN